jgi:hypothetical protein
LLSELKDKRWQALLVNFLIDILGFICFEMFQDAARGTPDVDTGSKLFFYMPL